MTNNEELAYREKHSRLWERYDEAAHDNAEHMRDILRETLDALENAERHILKTDKQQKALLAERDADKKRIAELEALTAEQDERLIAYAAIATKNASEDRTLSVKLPKPHAHLIWIQAGRGPDDYWDDVAVSHSLKDRCCDGSERYPVYSIFEIQNACAAASIKLEVGA